MGRIGTRRDAFWRQYLIQIHSFFVPVRLQMPVGVAGLREAAILTRHPHLRGMELPSLVEDARRVLETSGVAPRCEVLAGDYLESVPVGGDVYILKSIIHGMDETRAVRLLENCRRAIAARGRLLIIQVVVPPGNEPAGIKVGDILHLVSGGGEERTEAEYRGLLDAAGFTLVRVYPTGASFSILEAVPRH